MTINEQDDKICKALDNLGTKIQDLTNTIPNLKSRIEHMEAWRLQDSRIQEMEICRRAMTCMRNVGYNVELLPIHKLYDEIGQVILEWDGVFVAEKLNKNLLCLVEAKHQVKFEHIVNRLRARDTMQNILNVAITFARETSRTNVSASYRYVMSAIRPFAKYNLVLFIGGTSFDSLVLDKAVSRDIICVHISHGNRYDVTIPARLGERL